MIESRRALGAELDAGETFRRVLQSLLVAEQELCAGIPQDETNAVPGELEVHRHRNEAGTHNTEISREVFRSVEGENGNTVAPRQSAPPQRARDGVGHGIEPRIGELARPLFSAEIDDGDLVKGQVAANEVAKIGEARHYGLGFLQELAWSTVC